MCAALDLWEARCRPGFVGQRRVWSDVALVCGRDLRETCCEPGSAGRSAGGKRLRHAGHCRGGNTDNINESETRGIAKKMMWGRRQRTMPSGPGSVFPVPTQKQPGNHQIPRFFQMFQESALLHAWWNIVCYSDRSSVQSCRNKGCTINFWEMLQRCDASVLLFEFCCFRFSGALSRLHTWRDRSFVHRGYLALISTNIAK